MSGASASVPASTANLGPGYDILGLALSLRCSVTAEPADEWSVEHVGRHRPGRGEADAVLAGAQRAVGDHPLRLVVDNEIPVGRGLGSSAAALAAGAAAAIRCLPEEATHDRVYRLASALEGHPEQAAATVYGGLVLVPAEGLPMRLPLHPSLRPVVAIPSDTLATREARLVVDDHQPLDRVVRTLARVSALTAGLVTGDAGMLAAAHGDEVHESPRSDIDPLADDLISVAKLAGALHASRSGSGPGVVALATSESADRVARAFEAQGVEVLNEPADTTGLL